MAAAPGAVEQVDYNGDLHLRTIGDLPARGLCGSGVLDLTAVLLRFGLIAPDGALLGSSQASHLPWPKPAARLRDYGGQNSFVVSGEGPSGRPILITQDDIRKIQLAKAAIATAVQILSRQAKIKAAAVTTVYIAGAFGYSLRAASLVALGIIPAVWAERMESIGNTSLAGAALCLLNPRAKSLALSIAAKIKTFHLAAVPGFGKAFINNLNFPG
jgi:uncharacterized 2Fe-2S/4Fe-4S cluster protein (DUF4445 family)